MSVTHVTDGNPEAAGSGTAGTSRTIVLSASVADGAACG